MPCSEQGELDLGAQQFEGKLIETVYIYTIKLRNFELGWFEVPVISRWDRIPLDLPLRFQPFTTSYFELGHFEVFVIFPLFRTDPRFPRSKLNPVILNLSTLMDKQNTSEHR